MAQYVNHTDEVYTNPSAVKGQISKARLVCAGEVGKVKCVWKFDTA